MMKTSNEASAICARSAPDVSPAIRPNRSLGCIDEALEKNGAERLLARGEADASSISFFSAFEDYETALWTTLEKVSG